MMNSHASRTLKPSGLHAEVRRDDLGGDGFTLYIGGEQQSHVYTNDQTRLLFDYTRRIANVIDLLFDPRKPITALHIGGGALTLPRYIALTRPGSQQFVIEYEENLLDFVIEQLPLPNTGAGDISWVAGDARERLPLAAAQAPFDVIIADAYLGSTTPPQLTSVEFYREVLALLFPDGVLAVNVADDVGLAVVRAQTATVRTAVAAAAAAAAAQTAMRPASATSTVLVTGPGDLVNRRNEGNAVILASPGTRLLDIQSALLAAGPHPGGLVTPSRLDDFVGDAVAVVEGG